MNYINKLVKYFRNPEVNNKDLLAKLIKWSGEFEAEANYGDLFIHSRAKQKYILMRWNEYDSQQPGDKPNIQGRDDCTGNNPGFDSGGTLSKKSLADTKKSKCVRGSYEDEKNGIYY